MQNQNSSGRSSRSLLQRMNLRPSRFLTSVRRVLTIILVILIATTGLASLDNALAPPVQMTYAATGPDALAVVRALEINTRNGALFAGSNAGLFKSTDGGVTWLPSGHGLPGIDMQDLMFDPGSNTLYSVLFGVGLFKSTDDGVTWQNISRGFRGSELLTVALDAQTGALYAGLRGYGMWVSHNGGASWETIGMGLTNTSIRMLLTGPRPGEVFAATDWGVYHSREVTGTWDLLTGRPQQYSAWSIVRDAKSGALFAGSERGMLMLAPAGDGFTLTRAGLDQQNVQSVALDPQTGTLYAGTLGGVFLSTDRGANWSAASAGLRSTLVRALLLTGGGNTLFAATDSGIFRSMDHAVSWQPATLNPNARHVQALLVNQQDDTVYAGALGGGVFRSAGGGTNWQPINTGLNNAVVQALGVDHGSNLLYAGTRKGIYRSPIDAIGWTIASPTVANVDALVLAVDERKGAAYAVTVDGYLYRSGNAGADWDIVPAIQNVFARTVAVSSFNTAVYAGTYKSGVWVSRDNGFNWQPIAGPAQDRNIETMAVDERNGALYAGTLGGSVFLLTAERGGGGWQKVGDTLPGNVVALAVDERSDSIIAALKAGVFKITSGQAKWQLVTGDMSHTNVLALAAHRSTGAVYAGTTAGGAFRSDDAGARWTPASTGLTDIEMRGVVADDASGALFVGTTDRGVYRSDDEGKTWRAANVGLKELTSQSITSDRGDGTLSYLTASGQYQSTGSGAEATWQPQGVGAGGLLDLFAPVNAFGFVGRLPGGDLLWATRGGGELWARTVANLGMVNATIQLLPDGLGRLEAVWGAELAHSAPGAGYGRVPLAWLLVRAWVWSGFQWLAIHAPWWWIAVAGAIAVLLALFMLGRIHLNRVYGVPLRAALLTPGKSARLARPHALDAAWPKWERAVQGELYGYGDVRTTDLFTVPGPFRVYAMQRFVDTHGHEQSVEMRDNRLYARAREQMRCWADGWQAMRRDLRRDGAVWQRRKSVDVMARAFAATVGLELVPPVDNTSVRAYATRPAAGFTTPVALLFVADNEALTRTVQNLGEALDATKMGDARGLVISLGRPGRDVEVTHQVRNAIAQSDQAGRLAVLTNADVTAIMASHNPAQALAAHLQQPLSR